MSSEDTYYPNPAPYSNPSVSSYGGYFYPPAVPMPMVPAVPMVPAMPAMPYVDPALYYSTMQSFVGANNYYRPPPLNVNGDARTTPEATPEETPPPQPPAPASESSSSSSRGLFRPIDFESASSSTDESEQHGAMAPEPAAVSRSRQGEARPPESHGVTATLIHQRLWDEFHSLGNEMIVTKEGRRVFPILSIALKGLNPTTQYSISIRMVPLDDSRYKYIQCRWVPVSPTEIAHDKERLAMKHRDSPNTGSHWMQKPVCFKSLKITHHSGSKGGHILLQSMHKYSVETVIEPVEPYGTPIVIPLPNTTFIAVTAYQNTRLTALKVNNNAYAKSFRDKVSYGHQDESMFTHQAESSATYQNEMPASLLLSSPRDLHQRSRHHNLVQSPICPHPRPSPYYIPHYPHYPSTTAAVAAAALSNYYQNSMYCSPSFNILPNGPAESEASGGSTAGPSSNPG